MSEVEAGARVRAGRLARLAFVAVVVAAALLALEVMGPAPADAVGNIEELHDHEPDRDFRTGSVSPMAAQRSAASDLDATARWNQFGTPQSLINRDGFLAENVGGSDAEAAARSFLTENAAVFGLSTQYLGDPNRLALVNDTPMEGSDGHALFFSQKFGDLEAVKDGSVVVGLTGGGGSWDVAYVSSSLSRDTGVSGATDPNLTGEEAWLTAARAVGEGVTPAAIATADDDGGAKDAEGLAGEFTSLQVDGLDQEQQVRLTALPTPEGGVRAAYEAILIEDSGGETISFTSFVDANSGRILYRANNVQQLADETGVEYAQAEVPPPPESETFDGTFTASACGEEGPFTVAEGTGQISVTANATNPANDIVLQLVFGGEVVAEADTGTTPESLLYEPSGGVPAGDYAVRVCNFQGSPVLDPNTYTGFFLATEAEGPPEGAVPYPPEWNQFDANPPIGPSVASYPSTDNRRVICWNTLIYGDAAPAGCSLDVANQASRSPWDVNTKAAGNPPTFTTIGNNARSAESWYGATAPGPTGFRPTSATREYDYPWTNAWYESTNPADPGRGCSPTELVTPGEGNDISAATAALFATHNRIHDWSYNLGFTEQAYNLQDNNFGLTPATRENDPEIGDVQAGAVNGGAPSYVGRDNANQLTLNDGIAPITNMYLWQPISAAFYAPCVDGDYDVSVIAHEYGHAIQNRMVAGPDAGLSGLQARSMGESWSDLTAIEYLYEYGYEPGGGANRYAVGPYVTGDKQAGIRNYGMNRSPLNYSNIEYDPSGVTSPHADGEIWSAANFEIRSLLMDEYEGQYPSSPGTDLQQRCADGQTNARDCPGNRRWAQIFHDAFLLMPSAVSFLDARDAYLAADRMRFGGANQEELWLAFARRGMGEGARSSGTNDCDPLPSFASPLEDNAEITFDPKASNGDRINDFEVYVGRYEARAVPVADGRSSTNLTRTATLAPGTYEFVIRAPGYGVRRVGYTFSAGEAAARSPRMEANFASSSRGARPTATSDGTSGEDGASAAQLLDETEETNWRADGPVSGKQVTVNLAGSDHPVDRVQVSAFLRPQEQSNRFGDTDTQSRFSALRQFEILTCDARGSRDCSNPNRGFASVYTSPETAETGPAAAGEPRPTAPDLQLANFDVRDTTATHVQLRVISNQCTGAPAYQGDPDADPANDSDCTSGSDQDTVVRAAELQVFGR